MSLHLLVKYEHVAVNLTHHGLAAATVGKTCMFNINNACDQVEFKRISLTGFRTCTSRSRYRSISKADNMIRVNRFLALVWHLEEIHMTWAHLEKKQTRLRTYTKTLDESCSHRDVNPIRILRDYSRPIHEGYKNTIELPRGNNVDPNQHLKDFLKLVDSLDFDSANRERMRLHLFQFSLCDQASNWLERLPAGSISTWEDLTTRFLAQFFPSGRTTKLRNDILMFQQHQGESLSEA
ncbi:zinc finger, CCHC-type containing protein [Tanacetum coccineum]|uniref:Zinc finger, CCHC-type containing protein n=1 Tax=Tanacetum coccineum TaxID=301880 RepID=A0ABQ5FI84_9ASTR